jgi:hypothetical protein
MQLIKWVFSIVNLRIWDPSILSLNYRQSGFQGHSGVCLYSRNLEEEGNKEG